MGARYSLVGPHRLRAHPTPLPCPPTASGSRAASLAPSFPIGQLGSAVTRDLPVRGTESHGLQLPCEGAGTTCLCSFVIC